MSNYPEYAAAPPSHYHIDCPENRTEPVPAQVGQSLNYTDMSDYIRAWPDKLVSFVAERLCDDDMNAFARGLYEYICVADKDGPDFEEWRKT